MDDYIYELHLYVAGHKQRCGTLQIDKHTTFASLHTVLEIIFIQDSQAGHTFSTNNVTLKLEQEYEGFVDQYLVQEKDYITYKTTNKSYTIVLEHMLLRQEGYMYPRIIELGNTKDIDIEDLQSKIHLV